MTARAIYVTNLGNNTIKKFTPGGGGSLFADASDGVSGPQFLAFTDDAGVPLKLANQVPEPATLALLGLGLPSLLGRFRSRKR